MTILRAWPETIPYIYFYSTLDSISIEVRNLFDLTFNTHGPKFKDLSVKNKID